MSGAIGPRVAALCGVAFAAFLFLSVASLSVPDAASDAEMIDWWSKGGNQSAALFSMYLMAASAVALGLFMTHLRDRLNTAQAGAGNAMHTLGLAAIALFLASAAMRGVIGLAVKVNDEPLPGVDMLRYLPQSAYALVDMALIALGACILLAAWAIRQTGALPAWLAWAGFVAGVLVLAGVAVIGPFVLPVVWVWALAASAAVWRSPSAEKAPALQRASVSA